MLFCYLLFKKQMHLNHSTFKTFAVPKNKYSTLFLLTIWPLQYFCASSLNTDNDLGLPSINDASHSNNVPVKDNSTI